MLNLILKVISIVCLIYCILVCWLLMQHKYHKHNFFLKKQKVFSKKATFKGL